MNKRLTYGKLLQFMKKRHGNLRSNMQFQTDLRECGLESESLGNMTQYKNASGWSLYVWDLVGSELERTHRLVEFSGALFLVPIFFGIPEEYKLVEKT